MRRSEGEGEARGSGFFRRRQSADGVCGQLSGVSLQRASVRAIALYSSQTKHGAIEEKYHDTRTKYGKAERTIVKIKRMIIHFYLKRTRPLAHKLNLYFLNLFIKK